LPGHKRVIDCPLPESLIINPQAMNPYLLFGDILVPNTHARNHIAIGPQNYFFITKRKEKKRKVW
jgi:hypothetical protein